MFIERLREVLRMADVENDVMKSAIGAAITMGNDVNPADLAETGAPGKDPETVLPSGSAFETRFA
jgi:hypothetical protein